MSFFYLFISPAIASLVVARCCSTNLIYNVSSSYICSVKNSSSENVFVVRTSKSSVKMSFVRSARSPISALTDYPQCPRYTWIGLFNLESWTADQAHTPYRDGKNLPV
ncbi:hypothetical protein AVEN_157910-1 [Araneus ventricosus]|uniref:Secreted protein n=1 Tax=Araneus ventricosus TaxID=182803 RepID=A0A4Y2FHP4_ARAVE|nr:hypothetical protein AVEN_157910-1 [Araneus ventricosus]